MSATLLNLIAVVRDESSARLAQIRGTHGARKCDAVEAARQHIKFLLEITVANVSPGALIATAVHGEWPCGNCP